jgi:hypothetical protein
LILNVTLLFASSLFDLFVSTITNFIFSAVFFEYGMYLSSFTYICRKCDLIISLSTRWRSYWNWGI